jgi:probable phosphoglycerate mutase
MTLPDLLILRHGETEWNRAGRLQGKLDSPLTEEGLRQADRQAEILAALDLTGWSALSSPQGRALATAARALPGRSVLQDARLREIGLGDWTGRLRSDLAAEHPHLFQGEGLGWYDHAPGGEGLLALESRLRAFLGALNGPVVIVTHGITSRVLRCLAQGLPVEAFETVGGGQGVVYRVNGGQSELLR